MTQLYLISPPQFELADFRRQLEAALVSNLTHHVCGGDKGGEDSLHFIGAFQLRLKEADDQQIKLAIAELLPICRAHGVAFILNDRVDLCVELELDGVHVGQEDLAETSVKKIRNQFDESMALGVTCHASRHLAMEAAEAGADYVAFGAFYDTTSKPKEKLEKWGTPTPDILQWWSTYTEIPCVAIGGITQQNCAPLVEAGADFIAVITAVWDHPKGVAAGVKEFAAATSSAA